MRRTDDKDLPDSGKHKNGKGVVDHRLVIHGQQLLRCDGREWVEPGARSAGEEYPLHEAFFSVL